MGRDRNNLNPSSEISYRDVLLRKVTSAILALMNNNIYRLVQPYAALNLQGDNYSLLLLPTCEDNAFVIKKIENDTVQTANCMIAAIKGKI